MTAALERGEWSAARPGRTLPPGKDPVPIFTGGWVGPRAGLGGGKSRPYWDFLLFLYVYIRSYMLENIALISGCRDRKHEVM